MTKAQFLELMGFPPQWMSLDMYPDELFAGQLALYSSGDERAAEHDRNGAFHWWLRKGPSKEELRKLLQLALVDPDDLMSSDVRVHIRLAVAFDNELAEMDIRAER